MSLGIFFLEWEKRQDAWNVFKDMFMTVTDNHAPVIKRLLHGKSLPWKTTHIKRSNETTGLSQKDGNQNQRETALVCVQKTPKFHNNEAPQRKR